jgi:hypothetical protein
MKQFMSWIKLTIKLLGVAFMKAFVEYIEILVHELFEVDRGQLKKIPNFVIFLVYILCLSVIFQAGMDLVVETLMLAGFIEKIPLRVDFLFLTLISTVIGIQTLNGMFNHKLDVTRNSILIGIIVELALITGDLVLIIEDADKYDILPFIRLPFLTLTCMNLGILMYVAIRMKVFRDRHGKVRIF